MFHIKYLTSNKKYVSQTGESLKLGFHKQLKCTTTHNHWVDHKQTQNEIPKMYEEAA
jgi:hypothetical protein